MKNHLNGGRNSPHLFGQKNRTVYPGNEDQAEMFKYAEPGTNVVERGASFGFSYDNVSTWKQENNLRLASSTLRAREKSVSFRDDLRNEVMGEQATITKKKSGIIPEQETITEKKSAAVHEQGPVEIQELLRIRRNRIYLECLNISERILARYIPRGRKPLRYIQRFADELFEIRTKESEETYNEFLDEKIRELRFRNMRFSGFPLARLALKPGVDCVGGEEYGRS